MTLRLITPAGTLDESAWAHVCADAARCAADDSAGSTLSFRSRYSVAIVGLLARLPAGVRELALQLANEHAGLAAADELDAAGAAPATDGQPGFEAGDVHDTMEVMDEAWRQSERLHMLEGMVFPLRGARIDAAHGGAMTRAMTIGMLKIWDKAGQAAALYNVPQALRSGRTAYLAVIRPRCRLFCADYQLELAVSQDGASYASNIVLETDAGEELPPDALPVTYSAWLMAVLKAFGTAALRLDSMLEAPPLADCPGWAQVQAAMRGQLNKPRR